MRSTKTRARTLYGALGDAGRADVYALRRDEACERARSIEGWVTWSFRESIDARPSDALARVPFRRAESALAERRRPLTVYRV
jgi:hypothetical protein